MSLNCEVYWEDVLKFVYHVSITNQCTLGSFVCSGHSTLSLLQYVCWAASNLSQNMLVLRSRNTNTHAVTARVHLHTQGFKECSTTPNQGVLSNAVGYKNCSRCSTVVLKGSKAVNHSKHIIREKCLHVADSHSYPSLFTSDPNDTTPSI